MTSRRKGAHGSRSPSGPGEYVAKRTLEPERGRAVFSDGVETCGSVTQRRAVGGAKEERPEEQACILVVALLSSRLLRLDQEVALEKM